MLKKNQFPIDFYQKRLSALMLRHLKNEKKKYFFFIIQLIGNQDI
jgi:hypothetical protein